MKKGLVLEGGGLRGLFTAGVIDFFMEQNILFDGAIGVSAGAAFGCNFKSHQIGRVLRYNTRYRADKRYCSFHSFLTTGDLFGADFCYRVLPETLDPFDWEAFFAEPMPFWALCTETESGKPVPFLCEGDRARILDIFRASASMPLVSRKVKIDSETYLDGGIASSIPLSFMEKEGFEKNVVVLTRPREYKKSRSSILPLIALRYGRKSGLYRAMARRAEAYNAEKEYVFLREGEKAAFVIAPERPLPASRTEKDPAVLDQTHRIGYETAKALFPALQEFLAEDQSSSEV